MNFEYALKSLLTSNFRIYVVATGSGAGIQQALWSMPGSSSYLVGSSFPYAHDETAAFLGFRPGNVSIETAMDLAMAAYLRASDTPGKEALGLGITTSVASAKAHRGDHRIHAAVVTSKRIFSITEILEKGEGVKDRLRDGFATDRLGLEMLFAATGVCHRSFPDGTELARSRLFVHPLFKADGTRGTLADIPQRPMLFPGAFNPPHEGHFYDTPKDAIFQVTANPPHKAALSPTDMLTRARYFKGTGHILFTQDDPLYLDKARRFPGATFMIGHDSLVRMLDPKWGVAISPLLKEFDQLNIRFNVRPRADKDGIVRSLVDVLPSIDKRFHHLFRMMPMHPHVHLSSTKIRNGG